MTGRRFVVRLMGVRRESQTQDLGSKTEPGAPFVLVGFESGGKPACLIEESLTDLGADLSAAHPIDEEERGEKVKLQDPGSNYEPGAPSVLVGFESGGKPACLIEWSVTDWERTRTKWGAGQSL
jgi:hypothetical protein